MPALRTPSMSWSTFPSISPKMARFSSVDRTPLYAALARRGDRSRMPRPLRFAGVHGVEGMTLDARGVPGRRGAAPLIPGLAAPMPDDLTGLSAVYSTSR
jgi:hypothetical protein